MGTPRKPGSARVPENADGVRRGAFPEGLSAVAWDALDAPPTDRHAGAPQRPTSWRGRGGVSVSRGGGQACPDRPKRLSSWTRSRNRSLDRPLLGAPWLRHQRSLVQTSTDCGLGESLPRPLLDRVQGPEPAQVDPPAGDRRRGGELVRQGVRRQQLEL